MSHDPLQKVKDQWWDLNYSQNIKLNLSIHHSFAICIIDKIHCLKHQTMQTLYVINPIFHNQIAKND